MNTRIIAAAEAVMVAAVIGFGAAACTSTTVKRTSPSQPTQSQTQTAAPSKAPSTASDTGVVGDTFTITYGNGTEYKITLVRVIDPAKPQSEFEAAPSGKRLIGTEFKVTAIKGTVDENSNIDTTLQGSNGQIYNPTITSRLAEGTNFDSGSVKLAAGGSANGIVPFEIPDQVKVTTVKWKPQAGFSNMTVTWNVR